MRLAEDVEAIYAHGDWKKDPKMADAFQRLAQHCNAHLFWLD